LLSEVKRARTGRRLGRADIRVRALRLLPARQLLLEGERPVRPGSRALDILSTLVERAGDLVTKDELIARVWPCIHVEEGNLRVHVAAVGQALGDGQAGSRYLANVPGRGYRFVPPVVLTEVQAGAPWRPATVVRAHTLPAPLTRMVGRSEIVQRLVAQLPQRRLIAIVGPGGIGKTPPCPGSRSAPRTPTG
jgi:DNA-binding winged helix-turn-helix (wHTH) protein